jgi:predicted DCC family thiol-disulfide oxidoreductase YuxK
MYTRRYMQSVFRTLREKIRELIGIDIRSLAAMRVGVSLIVLYDVIHRLGDLSAHYGPGSVFPPELVQAGEWFSTWPTLFTLVSTMPWLVYLLFVGTALCAFFLLIGLRTRVASIGTWIGLLMIHTLDPLVLQGGDILIRLVLFLGMWLPWGRAFSVDAALSFPHTLPRGTVATAWSAVYLLQVAYIYFFAALEKTGDEWRIDGTAVYYALSIDQLSTPVGEFMLQFPLILMIETFGVLALQHASLFMLFSPIATFATRTLAMVLLMGMHLSFAIHMNLGPFSWISITALCGFMHPRVWDALGSYMARRWGGMTIYYDGDCGFCHRSVHLLRMALLLPDTRIMSAQENESVRADMLREDSWVIQTPNGNRYFGFEAFIEMCRRSLWLFWMVPVLRVSVCTAIGERVYRFVATHRSRVCTIPPPAHPPLPRSLRIGLTIASAAVAVLYIIAITTWNINNRHQFERLQPILSDYAGIVRMLGLDQWWNMFAPFPIKDDGWYLIEGFTSDGRVVNLLAPDEPLYDTKPPNGSALYANERWRKYLMNLSHVNYARYRKYFTEYLCRTNPGIERVELVFIVEHTMPDYAPPLLRRDLLEWRHCTRPESDRSVSE